MLQEHEPLDKITKFTGLSHAENAKIKSGTHPKR